MMKRDRRYISSFVVALLLLVSASQARAAEEITIEGNLRRTVEAGGWLVVSDAGKYLILNPQRYQREAWFREGALVEATGEAKPDVVTTYMEGVPFQVSSMRPLRRQNGSNSRSGRGGGDSAAARAAELTRVSVTGEAVVQMQPDTAIVTVAVVTQNASASEAQAENASRSDAVVRAVKSAAGPNAEVKTSGYMLQPQYAYKEGAPPRITSYIARNSVTVTMSDLTRVGAVIDAASRAGANTVENLSFTLRRDEQARRQALTAATREALEKARAVGQALGGRLVRVVEVQEAGMMRPPIPVYDRRASLAVAEASSAPTPIEPGSLDVRVQVQLTAEIEAR